MKNSTNIWDRLMEVLNADNLDDVAKKLDINASTLRGRKARGAIPYDKIVQNIDAKDITYVLKNKKVDAPDESKAITFKQTYNPAELKFADFDELHYELTESAVEHFLTVLTKNIEEAPFSKMAKLQIIDSVIRIAKQDLDEASSNEPST